MIVPSPDFDLVCLPERGVVSEYGHGDTVLGPHGKRDADVAFADHGAEPLEATSVSSGIPPAVGDV